MRIAFLTPEYVSEPKFDGGLANYIYKVTRLLKEAGHDPEVFVTGQMDEVVEHKGIVVHRCTVSRNMQRLHRWQRVLFRKHWLGYMDVLSTAQALGKAFKAVNRRKPFDLVEASNFKATGLFLNAGVFAGTRVPIVVRISCCGELSTSVSGLKRRVVRDWLENTTVRRARAVYGPSSSLAKKMSERTGRKIEVIHPPLYKDVPDDQEDSSVWRQKLEGRRYVLFMGRICKVKGADVLAKAMNDVLRKVEDLYLVFVGRMENDEIENEIRCSLHEVRHRVIELGRLQHAQMFPVLRMAELTVLPSRIDNYPNACIEAMLVGQIVIGTRGTGFEDLIENTVDGFLVERGNERELKERILEVLSLCEEKKQRIKTNARRVCLNQGPEAAIRDLTKFYSNTVELDGCLSRSFGTR